MAQRPSSLLRTPDGKRAERSETCSGSPPSTSPPPPSPPNSDNTTPSSLSTKRSTAHNTVCQFIKHMKYDKAELVEVEDVLKPTRQCVVCKTSTTKACGNCQTSYFCSAECLKSGWKKHKKTCKPPTSPPATEAELRTLHKGMALLNMCIQRNGAGDGPTSDVLGFLIVGPAYY